MNSTFFSQQQIALNQMITAQIMLLLADYFIVNASDSEDTPVIFDIFSETIEECHVATISKSSVILNNGTEMAWGEIGNTSDLISILEWLENNLPTIKPDRIHLTWTTNDLEERALMHECNADGEFDDDDFDPDTESRRPEPIYDRAKFADALALMQLRHDCNYGVTWDTIDCALDEYCKL